ncbi:MAG: hypothetical protein BMS9Abin04_347 [Planctomycetia bacterium]|nr:MAG: hypothetical protein BMS9Abin04_347 [Planctomycetia bacterium]
MPHVESQGLWPIYGGTIGLISRLRTCVEQRGAGGGASLADLPPACRTPSATALGFSGTGSSAGNPWPPALPLPQPLVVVHIFQHGQECWPRGRVIRDLKDQKDQEDGFGTFLGPFGPLGPLGPFGVFRAPVSTSRSCRRARGQSGSRQNVYNNEPPAPPHNIAGTTARKWQTAVPAMLWGGGPGGSTAFAQSTGCTRTPSDMPGGIAQVFARPYIRF